MDKREKEMKLCKCKIEDVKESCWWKNFGRPPETFQIYNGRWERVMHQKEPYKPDLVCAKCNKPVKGIISAVKT